MEPLPSTAMAVTLVTAAGNAGVSAVQVLAMLPPEAAVVQIVAGAPCVAM